MKIRALCTIGLALAALPAVAQVTGSGTTNYVPVWTSSSAIGNSKIYQSGSDIGIGNTAPAHTLDVTGSVNASVSYLVNGNTMIATPGSDTNSAIGVTSLVSVTSATQDTAVGFNALYKTTTGGGNTAVGYNSILYNTTGTYNAALGAFALQDVTGGNNTGLGYGALSYVTTGANNIGVGMDAGVSLTTGSNNIIIGNNGTSTDTDTIRLGVPGTQTKFFTAGVRGVTTGLSNAVDVVIDGNGQLGTVNSSIRFKEDVRDMGGASDGLMSLRPVTYRYKQAYADGSKPIDYGLIAEEVAKVYPDLVVSSADGQVLTVQYQKLTPMLLNEVQKQREIIQTLEKRLEALEAALQQR
jgi:hypothetical protein